MHGLLNVKIEVSFFLVYVYMLLNVISSEDLKQ